MDAVIKVGGSLAENPPVLKTLCNKLSDISKKHAIIAVPGGGKFADVVREFDQHYNLSADVAHAMAILSMDQYGLLLSQVIPNSCATYSLREAKRLSEGKVMPVFLPSKMLFQKKPLEPSWDVTSDSIAAYIASQVNMQQLVLVKDVDGIFKSDPKKNPNAKFFPKLSTAKLLTFVQRTGVDKFLPKLLLEARVDCYVVNGAYPERIDAIFAGQNTVCTFIKA